MYSITYSYYLDNTWYFYNTPDTRRGQRRYNAKISRFWARALMPVVEFITLGTPRKSFKRIYLNRKRCIGEFKRKVL